jgi:hypothetical protein
MSHIGFRCVPVSTVIVLHHRGPEPVHVLVAKLRLLRRELGEPPDREVQLDRHRLLAPERAVVVEDGDPRLGLDEIRPGDGGRRGLDLVRVRDPGDEVDDAGLRRPVHPGVEISHDRSSSTGQESVQLLDGWACRSPSRLRPLAAARDAPSGAV